jgi:predicted nuclease of predicted toxin-antitoxin system
LDHFRQLGLADAEDYDIVMFARANGYEAVITADDDFVKLINQFSEPPKIIWVRTGNCSKEYFQSCLGTK